MKKPADFATYKKVKELSFNDFNRWVMSIYASGYQDGINEADNDCIAALTDDRLMELILSVKGIGKNRAKELIDKICNEGTENAYGHET